MRYEILTYDIYAESFTPQKGVKRGPHTFASLIGARRRLREMGYEPGSPSVLITRLYSPSEMTKWNEEIEKWNRKQAQPDLFA